MFVQRLTDKEVLEMAKACYLNSYCGANASHVKDIMSGSVVNKNGSAGVYFSLNASSSDFTKNRDCVIMEDFGFYSNFLGQGAEYYYYKLMYKRFGAEWFNAFSKHCKQEILTEYLDGVSKVTAESKIVRDKRYEKIQINLLAKECKEKLVNYKSRMKAIKEYITSDSTDVVVKE